MDVARAFQFFTEFAIGIVVFAVLLYVLNGLIFMRIGRKAGVDWAWVAWIPGGAVFVVARVADWPYWALWPILVVWRTA